MSDNDRHVVPHADGGWDVKAPHAERASSHHDTQAEAIDRAREIIGNAGGGELVTHGTDGRIRESDTVAAARRDLDHTAEQGAAEDGIATPVPVPMTDPTDPAPAEPKPIGQTEAREATSVDLSTTELRDEASSDAVPGGRSAAVAEEPKPTLGDKVKKNRSRITSLGPIVLGVIFLIVGLLLGKDQGSDANTVSNTASKILLTVGLLLVVIGVIALVVRTLRARRST